MGITAMKKQQRVDKLDDDAHKSQSSWSKFFYTKASTRSKCGFMSGKPKESIFKVPETLEGKVGVVGSGREMTKFAEPRKFTYQYVRAGVCCFCVYIIMACKTEAGVHSKCVLDQCLF